MSHGGESGNDVEELSEDDEQIQLNHAEKIENEYERNLREQEEKKQQLEKNAQLMDLKKQKERDFRKYAMKWAPVAFVGTFAPLCLCIFTIIVGTLVVETASTDCVQPLDDYIRTQIAFSYIFVFFYALMTIGPIPFTGLRAIKWFGILWSSGVAIVNLVGSAYVGGASPCSDTAPALLSFSTFQVLLFWVSLLIAAGYAVQHFFERKKSTVQQSAAVESMDDEDDEDDEEDEDGEDGEQAEGAEDDGEAEKDSDDEAASNEDSKA